MAQSVYGQPCVQGHTAMIYERGGATRIHQFVDLANVNWNRERNSITDGDILLTGRSCREQSTAIREIEPRRHELVIFRGLDRVWEGPVVHVSTFSDSAHIIAKDIGEYMKYTPLTKRWPSSGNGGPALMTERIDQIIRYELVTPYTAIIGAGDAATPITFERWETIDPPANILPFLEVRPGAVFTRSDTLPFELMLMEHLQNLAETGLDFTTVGRKFLIWDKAQSLSKTRTVTEQDFQGDPEIISSGEDFASIFHVAIQREEEEADPMFGVGSAGTNDPYYGPWTMLHTPENEEGEEQDPDQSALNTQAQRGLSGRNPIPLEIRMPGSAGIRLNYDLTINQLVPGVEMPVLARLNLREVSQMQIIDKVQVKEDTGGENISVTLVPSGPALAVL